MDDETRGHLHAALHYLQVSEAKDYYQRQGHDRGHHIYAHALHLMRHFGFDDLLEWDAECQELCKVG
jgi:hypothetical protein